MSNRRIFKESSERKKCSTEWSKEVDFGGTLKTVKGYDRWWIYFTDKKLNNNYKLKQQLKGFKNILVLL